jgi:glycosyltransferase involved in cell wall biosynthesis
MGGAEKLILEYSLNIDKNKFDITILCIYGKKNTIYENILEKNNIKVIYIDDLGWSQKNKRTIFMKIRNKLYLLKHVKKIIEQIQPDIIHSHLKVSQYLLHINTKKNRTKRFHTIHSVPNSDKGVHKVANSICFKIKNTIPICLHESMLDEVKRYYGINDGVVIKNGIDLERFRHITKSENQIRKELGIQNTDFIIGHIGRFQTPKNHEFIIDVFYELKKQVNKSVLLLIGTGDLEKKIREKVRKMNLDGSVKFLGNRSDIPELLSIMNVFLFPSLYEGLGIVLVEAQAVGIRCIVSNNVPDAVYLTENIVGLDLNEPIEKWCKVILNESIKGKPVDSINSYNIKNIVRQLEDLYLS